MNDAQKYYWIKLRTDFFNQDTIDFILSQKNGCEYIVLYQMLCLQTANNNGELSAKIGEAIIPYDVEKIVRDTKYFDFDTVTIAIELFKRLGLVYESGDDGTLRIANYTAMIGSESASKSAIKKRDYRARLKDNSPQGDNIGDKEGDNIGDKLSDRDRERDRDRDKEKDIDNIKEKNKKKKISEMIEDYTDDEDLREALTGFVEMRKTIKAPLTDRALKLTLNKLDSLGNSVGEKVAIVEQSIVRCWKGLFPVKGGYTGEPHIPTDADYDFSDYYEER